MRLESRKLLEDVRQAAELILQFATGQFATGRTIRDYSENALLRSGIERQFEIIGEAINQLAKLDAATASRISQRRIIDFRNILIHGYDLVDTNVAWDVVQNDLPALLREVAALLSEPAGQT